MLYLRSIDVSASLAVLTYKTYDYPVITIVKNEPYRLANEIWGIGFKTADDIARASGLAPDSPQRVKAALQYVLSNASEQGHCYLTAPNLVADTVEVIGVDHSLVTTCLVELENEGAYLKAKEIPTGDTSIPARYLMPLYPVESGLASGLHAIIGASNGRLSSLEGLAWVKAFSWLRASLALT